MNNSIKSNHSHQGLTSHLFDALKLNISRSWSYAWRSGGRSVPLSLLLIFAEAIGLIRAWFIDRRAARFQARGISIICGDLVPVTGDCPSTKRVMATHVASQRAMKSVAGEVDRYRKRAITLLNAHNFKAVGELSHGLLEKLKVVEEKERCSFAMTRHIVESIGLGACHAIEYSQQSHQETDRLAIDFLSLQAYPLKLSVSVDGMAQKVHAKGVGIVLNDIPAIPFEEAWQHLEEDPIR